jgi:heterodisulfide reductase subunit B
MGDSMFIYADHLINKYPAKKVAILEAIDGANGIGEYEKECNLYPYNDHAEKIYALEAQLPYYLKEGFTDKDMAYYDKAEDALCSKFTVSKDEDCALETIVDNITLAKITPEVKHPFSDFKVAFYAGDFACCDIAEVKQNAKEVLEAIGAQVVDFAASTKGDGFDIVGAERSIAYKKAGAIIFDAFDSGAEILVVDSKETHYMIDKCKKEVERAVGRDIRLPVLNISQIVGLSLGMSGESLGVDAHKIVVDFI